MSHLSLLSIDAYMKETSLLITTSSDGNPSTSDSSAWDPVWYKEEKLEAVELIADINRKVRRVAVYNSWMLGVALAEVEVYGIRE